MLSLPGCGWNLGPVPAKHLQLGSTPDFSFFERVSSYVDQVGLENPTQPTLAPSSPSYGLSIVNAVIQGCYHLTLLLHFPVSIISNTSDQQTPLPA